MIATEQNSGGSVKPRSAGRCVLCPAGCELSLASAGPDRWRTEYPLQAGGGLCPRGSALGELIGHPARILSPYKRIDGQLVETATDDVVVAVLAAASGRGITFILDANIPCEQMVSAAAWCGAWPEARLCFAAEPAEWDLLEGLEAGEANYLSPKTLAQCDGFVIIGDAFSANPTLARAVFDQRTENRRIPIVVIDPALGVAAKFATHSLAVAPGMELEALAALAAGAGLTTDPCSPARPEDMPLAMSAGRAIANCQQLGVLIAAEYSRSSAWRQIGYLASQFAKGLGGGIAAQTSGVNILAAVRMSGALGAVSLGSALSDAGSLRVAVGCDVLGMLGGPDLAVFAAAAAAPNGTTELAEVVLPTLLAAEMTGSYLFDGDQIVDVSSALDPPAGVPGPAEVIEYFARGAGVASPATSLGVSPAQRLRVDIPAPAAISSSPPSKALLFQRKSLHAGCGELTGWASWQGAVEPLPIARISSADARELDVDDGQVVAIHANGRSIRSAVRIAQELPQGIVVIGEGFAEARGLAPCAIEAGAITPPGAAPVDVSK